MSTATARRGYTGIIVKDSKGIYVAFVQELPQAVVQGNDIPTVKTKLSKALKMVLAYNQKYQEIDSFYYQESV